MSHRFSDPRPFVDPSSRVTDCRLGAYVDIGPRCIVQESEFGDFSYVARDAEIAATRIGRFVSIAAATRINPGNHPMTRAAQHHFTYRSANYGLGEEDDAVFDWRRGFPVEIGPDVWIGHGAVVLPGRRIGTGAAVGAGSVVTRDVPDYAIVAGNPARILRPRFPADVQARLLRIAWWDWPVAAIKAALHDFRTLSVEAFCDRYDR